MTTGTLIAMVDGSAYSESVCHHAAWIAKRTGAKVKLYHVIGRREGVEQGDLSGSIRLGARTKLLEELSALDAQRAKLAQAQGRAILEDAKALIEGDGVAEVETRLRQGDIVETITAKEDTADMLVVGKRGEAADFAKLHLGSNLERIVRSSRKPVFVANRAFREIGKVMIAFDGGMSSMKAVDYVARDPLFAGLKVLLVTVGSETETLKKAMRDAQATLSAGGHTVDARVVTGQPEKVLGDLTEAEGIDLLVMGAYGHSRVRSMIIGSTTSEMIRTCRVPIVLMR